MTILIYARNGTDTEERLRQVLGPWALDKNIQWCKTIPSFITRLCRPLSEPVVALLVAADERDLMGILSCRHLLQEMRLVLILPDRDSKMVAAAHKLHPRYLAYRDDDAREIGAVLERMLAGSGLVFA